MARSEGETTFDKAVAAFSRERPRYEKLAAYVCGLIRDHCGASLIHTTEYRAKAIDSFDKKCRKSNDDGSLRYPQPLSQLTDLAGVRVIVFLRDSVDVVCDEISKIFDVIENEDVGDRVYRTGKFGYQSKHLLIRLAKDRRDLVENSSVRDLVCEIQVRTLLQHAWAEMEHDIQYKTDVDIPLDLNKRFSALAGLLEIADREFASIQRDSEALKNAVREELISDLTHETLNPTSSTNKERKSSKLSTDARELVSSGNYFAAIRIYTEKISSEPNSYTLFLGRARALFLIGDVKGAIADLDEADRLSGDSTRTSRLRDIIQRGDDPRRALRSLQAPSKFAADLQLATTAIREGDGVRAFDSYSRLEVIGYSRPYSLFGKAMACAIERDIEGARGFLRSLELRPGTPMAVNICGLTCLLDLLGDGNWQSSAGELQESLEQVPHFDLDLSFLGNLREGLRSKRLEQAEAIESLFEYIGQNSKRMSSGDAP